MRKSKMWQRMCGLSLIVITLLAVGGQGHAAPTGTKHLASIAFATTISDTELGALLSEHDLQARTAFMWVEGFSGSYRVINEELIPRRVEQLLEDARNATARQFATAVDRHPARVREYLSSTSLEAVVTSADLTTQVQSLVALYEQLRGAHEAVTSGVPLVYGLEVEGSDEQLERVRRNPKVVNFQYEETRGGRRGVRPPSKPEQYQNGRQDARIEPMGGPAAYAAAVRIAGVK